MDTRKASDIVGVVLTGGGSRRMGRPKCDLVVGGASVAGRLCQLLARRTGEVIIVGRKPELPEAAGVPVHADDWPGQGPLGGIATGLRVAAGAAVCVVACDAVGMGGELLDFLLAGRDARAAATVLGNPRTGLVEPMPGVYEARGLASMVAAMEAGGRSVMDWLAREQARRLAAPEALGEQFLGANTPEELAALEQRLRGD